MTPLLFVTIALAGGLGACARMMLDGVIKTRLSRAHPEWSLPWGTIVINLSGSLALGFIVGLTGAHLLPEATHLVLGTGFLGGYTTFSTASFETVRLLQQGRRRAGLVNACGTLLGATALAGLGFWAGSVV